MLQMNNNCPRRLADSALDFCKLFCANNIWSPPSAPSTGKRYLRARNRQSCKAASQQTGGLAACRSRQPVDNDKAALRARRPVLPVLLHALPSLGRVPRKEEALRAKQAANRLRELGDSPRRSHTGAFRPFLSRVFRVSPCKRPGSSTNTWLGMCPLACGR